jgi:genome maintenance exonuclease 1
MHSYLEHYIKTGTMKDRGPNPFSWASHAMAQSVIKNGLQKVSEFWGIEVPLYFPKIYAGTTDCIGIHEGKLAILDFKQTNKPKKEEWIDDYKLQLAAYAEAHDEVYKTSIEKGVILMCVKPSRDTYEPDEVIPEPPYQEFEVSPDELRLWRRKWWERVEQYYASL